MTTPPFVHLHVHSDYSLLDGAESVSSIIKQAVKFGMPAVALTDHGTMSGVYALTTTCEALAHDKEHPAELNGIVGCEFYVAPGSHLDHSFTEANKDRFHLVVLAENHQGYVNMCHLSQEAWLKGFYGKPRIDFDLLQKHKDGIVVLSACLSGQVQKLLLRNYDKEAEEVARRYRDLLGEKHYYIELQDHGLEDQHAINDRLIALANKLGIGMVVTNDSHYLRQEDAEAQDLMVCIGTQTTIQDPKRMRFGTDQFYFKSQEEMAKLFPAIPEAMSNTVEIASRCHVHLPTVEADHANHYPAYPEPPVEGKDPDQVREEHLRQLCHDGLQWRYHFDPDKDEITEERQKILDRMNYEIGIIKRMGFISYYLVVWDFLHYAAKIGVPLGPGRGSGAGSLVAYLIGITHIDPLRYNLLFERFLNPERVSPPDFDIDLCERRRHEVIEYVRSKYGADRVVQIGTFGTLKAKQVVKDVARAMGRSFDEGNQFAKLIPADPKMTLDIALNGSEKLKCPPSPELKAKIESEPWCQELWKYAKVLEGLNRNMSIHAAGVIIGDMPVAEVAPIARGAGDEPITQFSAIPCESLGLLKMDFLGLKTLTLIQDALDLVEESAGIKILSNDIPEGDPKTYQLLGEGKTIAVFQLESGGMQELCRKWRPTRLEDIIALIAIYRPGPMEFIPDFLGRKEGRIPMDYDVPEMEPLLAETNGIMLYQEQIMQVAQVVAGFTLGQADILRRAIGKKKIKVMEKMKVSFQQGCLDHGISNEISENIWTKILKFAGYGFNKSHSAAYGLLTYRTAYLKANYPAAFMAAVLTSELSNSEKMAFYLKECREMGIRILPPDINICGKSFSVSGKDIRFGLAAIKGVGGGIVETILKERKAGGRFKGMMDLCERVEGVNSRLLDALVRSGALDCFGHRREELLVAIERVLSRSAEARADRKSGQLDFFAAMTPGNKEDDEDLYRGYQELPLETLLGYEKELLGFFVSGHPIDKEHERIETYQIDDLVDLPSLPPPDKEVVFRTGAYIAHCVKKISKKSQKPFAILTLESREASYEALLFNREYESTLKNYPELLEEGSIAIVEGIATKEEEENSSTLKLRVNKLIPMDHAAEFFTSKISLIIDEKDATQEKLALFLQLCSRHHGPAEIHVGVRLENGECLFFKRQGLTVKSSERFLTALAKLFGKENVRPRGIKVRPQPPKRGSYLGNTGGIATEE